MKNVPAVGIFLFLFSLSLQGESSSSVDLPRDCFAKKRYPCSIAANEKILIFERGTASYRLGPKAAVRFESENRVRVLLGSVWIEKSQGLQVEVQPGLSMNFSGDFLLEKQEASQLMVRNLNGVVSFQSPYLMKDEALPVGFQNWYGTLTTQKQISRGLIRPIKVPSFLKVWRSLAGLSAAEIGGRFQSYKAVWGDSQEISAQFYKDVVERGLASQNALDQRRTLQQEADLQEKKRLHQMYRQKAGFEEESQ